LNRPVRRRTIVQAPFAGLALARLARGRRRRPPLAAAGAPPPPGTVSVVVPARDEAARIGPCLGGACGDPDVLEVVVVDDCSRDATAAVAAAAGARVVAGALLPPAWVGKPWALQQGLAAARGDFVVFLDADAAPRPGLARALVARLAAGADLVTAAARFRCASAGERLLHPSLLASLVYRFGPAGTAPSRPGRLLANGQCLAARRTTLAAAGGFAPARAHMTDDVALARALAAAGWRVAFEDATALLEVRMHASAREAWRQWGRSLALVDVTAPAALAGDLALCWLVLAVPVLAALAGRASALERVLLAVRFVLLAPLARAYARRGIAFWLSPLADPATAMRLTLSALRPAREWRGRTYGRRGTAHRSGS
jgi:dolichol-phosphate mannosyltransferase